MIIYLKSKEEIDGFIEVGKISGKILKTILKEIKPGIKTKYLDEIAMEECRKNNVTPTFLGYSGFPAAICVSVNEILVHGIPGDYILKENDVVSIDFGATLDGFIGDTAETVYVNNNKISLTHDFKTEEVILEPKIVKCCRFCLNYYIENYCNPGDKLSKGCDYVFRFAKQNGFSVPKEYGGHGISKNKLHDFPYIPCSAFDIKDVTLYPGMILAIEPMFIQGKGTTKVLEDKWTVKTDGISAHCEHTILITEDKPIVLTRRENV